MLPEQHPQSPLSVGLQCVVAPLLFMAVFAGFQGGRYYFANRLQELGIACALLLFALGAWRALFLLDAAQWKTWVYRPILLLLGIMSVSALVFSLNYHGSVLYSFFSAREFLLAFMGPGVYLLCRTGVDVEMVERVVWTALIALLLNYLYFYFTLDLEAAFFSSDHTVSNLVTFDEWRGFRLKPPLFAVMISLLAGLMLLLQCRGLAASMFAITLLGIAAYIWSIVQFRATLASMLLAVLLYPLFLSKRRRLPAALVILPLLFLAVPLLAPLVLTHFLDADGGNIRAAAFRLATVHIFRHPLLGAGEDSAYGDSYQDLVAPYFFPSDLGLVGTCYKYGVVGAALYLFMHWRIWQRLWQGNISFSAQAGHTNPLLWGLLLFMTAQTFNLLLNPGLAYAQGITAGTLALALASVHCQVRDPAVFAN